MPLAVCIHKERSNECKVYYYKLVWDAYCKCIQRIECLLFKKINRKGNEKTQIQKIQILEQNKY